MCSVFELEAHDFLLHSFFSYIVLYGLVSFVVFSFVNYHLKSIYFSRENMPMALLYFLRLTSLSVCAVSLRLHEYMIGRIGKKNACVTSFSNVV